MVTKLFIIALLAVKHIFAEGTGTPPLTLPTSLTGITTPKTTSDSELASIIITNSQPTVGSSDSFFQLHSKARNSDRIEGDYITPKLQGELKYSADNFNCYPVVKYETQNNHSHRQHKKQEQQLQNESKDNGFIEFKVDNYVGKVPPENSDVNTAIGTEKSSSSPLNQILVSLFPEKVAENIRLSYGAEPGNANKQLTVPQRGTTNLKENNEIKKIYNTQPLSKSSIMRPLLPSHVQQLPPQQLAWPSKIVTCVNEIKTIRFRPMTNESLNNINNTVEVIQFPEKMVLPNIVFAGKYQNISQISPPLCDPINVDNRNNSDYEDMYLHLNNDNLVTSSQEASKQLIQHPSKESQDRAGPGSSLQNQISAPIIRDKPGDLFEKIVSFPTRHLDEFQEKVEKQFSRKHPYIETEMASRNFLKNFKEGVLGPPLMNSGNEIVSSSKTIQPESLLHTYIYSSESNNNNFSADRQSYVAPPAGSLLTSNEKVQTQSQSRSSYPENLVFTNHYTNNESDATPLEEQYQMFYGVKKADEVSENQEARPSLHSDVFSSKLQRNIYVTGRSLKELSYDIRSSTLHPQVPNIPQTLTEFQNSFNIHNKFITEQNGNSREEHEIYGRPELLYYRPVSLSVHPIRVEQTEETQQYEITLKPASVLQQQHQAHQTQSQEQLDNSGNVVEKPAMGDYSVKAEKTISQPIERLKKKYEYIDLPVPIEHIVEKQANIPYPVRELVERIVDRPVPVEKIVNRPVNIPYPVQVDHFIDRPYAVQVPVAIALPIPVNRYIDRPYPVERVIQKPIHIPYPIEKVVEKIVEKHVPVEVERIVEKPIEMIAKRPIDWPYVMKKFFAHTIPIHIPVPVVVPVGLTLTKINDSKKKSETHTSESRDDDVVELLSPPLSTADGCQDYRTLPENIDKTLIDYYNGPVPKENPCIYWDRLAKRDAKNNYVKRSPELKRNLRVEYGFRPPLVPSLEIVTQRISVENDMAKLQSVRL